MSLGDQAEDRVVAVMKRFGYTGTDARTYIAVLRYHPATGYELAARGGVPRSAIYGVLKRLEQAGLVNAVRGKPARYIPLAPERLIEHLETRFSRDVADFREAVTQVSGPDVATLTWTVSGYESQLAEAERLIDNAVESIVCSLWRKEALQLQPAIERAIARGVVVTTFSFTRLPEDMGTVLSYGIEEEALAAHWTRRVVVVADRAQLLVGEAAGRQLDRAVVSEEMVLVEMAIANLVLDITLFSQREGVDVSDTIGQLTQRLAPIDQLLSARQG
jgi:HTH-type transcriptional regulator, sugar sensing transcriptional regulator